MYNHERLIFFRRANAVSKLVAEISLGFPKFETYELGSQMRRAADSIIFNIAEGGSKSSVADMINYLRHALGSVKELRVQVLKVCERGYY
jgi:four helix bundle protein